jgi:hypothetical protein
MKKSKFSFFWNLVKNKKRGRFFIAYYLVAYIWDKTLYFLSLTLLKTSFKEKVYKKYLKYRLKNLKK